MTYYIENKRVWFITGASKGLGYAFTCAAFLGSGSPYEISR